jgi:hypothetical protein
MKQESKKRILVLITNTYAAINFIHSGLVKSLSDEYDIFILSSFIKERDLDNISRHFNVRLFSVNTPIPAESRMIRFLRLAEKAVFFHFFKITTQEIKNAGRGVLYKLFIKSLLGIIHGAGISRVLLKLLRNNIIRLSKDRVNLKTFKTIGFSGVISSSPLDIRENSIVNALRRENVPSLATVISWDNLTSKGIINANHDYILVWNQVMADEYTLYYKIFNVANQKICITGIPRFDIYFRTPPTPDTELAFRKKYLFNREDKIILFATSAISHFPNQTDILEHLLEYASAHQDVKVIVRCHPGDDFERYSGYLHNANLRLVKARDRANINSAEFLPDLSVLTSLHEMLNYCDACIQVASTICIEAAVCKTPVISIAYDGNRYLPYMKSVRRFYDYSHQQTLNNLGIDHRVYSKQDLFTALGNILCRQTSDVSRFQKIDAITCHSAPIAIPTTMKYIQQWLS